VIQRMLGLLIAGTLAGAPMALASVAAAPKPTTFTFTMSGAQVVPGPGDPDGTANAALSLFFKKPSHVCAGTNPQNVQRPFTALHLHHAPAGDVRPEVTTLTGGATDASGCGPVPKKVLQDIQNNPEQYYLDAHNEEFPDGAIRGQLT
jgi:CHRD domain